MQLNHGLDLLSENASRLSNNFFITRKAKNPQRQLRVSTVLSNKIEV